MLAEVKEPGPGHNLPPTLAESARADMTRESAAIGARAVQLFDGANRAAVVDAESAGKGADLVKFIRAASAKLDDIHTETKAPYLAAGREVDAVRRTIADTLDSAKKLILGKIETFQAEERLKAQAERRRLDEIARQAAIKTAEEGRAAEPVAAPAPAPAPAKIEGDYGSKLGTKDNWVGTVTDYTKAFDAVQSNAKVREAIDKAIQAMVRSGAREIGGVTIENKPVSNIT